MLVSVPYGAYFIFGSVNFIMAIVAFWVPETKGVSQPHNTLNRKIISILTYIRFPLNVWMNYLVSPIFRTLKILGLQQNMLKS
jgi:Mg2+/Co2+ transporter CorB